MPVALPSPQSSTLGHGLQIICQVLEAGHGAFVAITSLSREAPEAADSYHVVAVTAPTSTT